MLIIRLIILLQHPSEGEAKQLNKSFSFLIWNLLIASNRLGTCHERTMQTLSESGKLSMGRASEPVGGKRSKASGLGRIICASSRLVRGCAMWAQLRDGAIWSRQEGRK